MCVTTFSERYDERVIDNYSVRLTIADWTLHTIRTIEITYIIRKDLSQDTLELLNIILLRKKLNFTT